MTEKKESAGEGCSNGVFGLVLSLFALFMSDSTGISLTIAALFIGNWEARSRAGGPSALPGDSHAFYRFLWKKFPSFSDFFRFFDLIFHGDVVFLTHRSVNKR